MKSVTHYGGFTSKLLASQETPLPTEENEQAGRYSHRGQNPSAVRNALLSMCTISKKIIRNEEKQDEKHEKKIYRRNAIIPTFSNPRRSQMTEGSDNMRKSNAFPQIPFANLFKVAPRNSGMLNSGSGEREQINRASFITNQQVINSGNSDQDAQQNDAQLDVTINNQILKRRVTMTKQGKLQFYDRIKANKAIIVPEGALLEEAMRLQTPCFSIVEDSMVVKRKKKRPEPTGREKQTEITSKIMRMPIMNLMWNITESQLQQNNGKFPRSAALNIRKFKGLAGEKLNTNYVKNTPRLQEEDQVIIEETALESGQTFTPKNAPRLPELLSPANILSKISFKINSNDDDATSPTNNQIALKRRKTLRLSVDQQVKIPTEQELYISKVKKVELEKLRQSINQQVEREEELKQYKNMLKPYYRGEMCARPKYKFKRFRPQTLHEASSNLFHLVENSKLNP
ncbi:hypothetical protein FGO68_gene11279 [Halteria grandinella]|uniref:Uncharacterized protein n=1 Tax=Halteria grandinella TaxID=5974 RepID=A0A8J8T1I3_HALGN|nr:hypothetical protein FGO68_gene11279 [Halteria grandinella]